MKAKVSVSGIAVWLLLTVLTNQASCIENGNELVDTMTKLAENLSQLSKQVAGQSEQLINVFKKLEKQSEKLDMLAEQSNRFEKMADEQTDLNDRMNRLEQESSAGPTFIRWGKSSCNGTNSRMVYSGVASGTDDTGQGGGANLLCLPKNPTFDNYDGAGSPGINVVIAEYKLDPANNFPFEDNDPLLLDNDVPCAVCEVTNSSSVMMIPGNVDCYSDWRMEYRGYLMAENYPAYRSEFVCVDKNPEVLFGGAEPADYSLGLYPTEAYCGTGSLPCPPYEEGWELACVVCSK